jgi:hypothetical protein
MLIASKDLKDMHFLAITINVHAADHTIIKNYYKKIKKLKNDICIIYKNFGLIKISLIFIIF